MSTVAEPVAFVAPKEMPKASGVYEMRLGDDNYVGASWNLRLRAQQHTYARRPLVPTFRVLELHDPKGLGTREREWISKLNPTLNSKKNVRGGKDRTVGDVPITNIGLEAETLRLVRALADVDERAVRDMIRVLVRRGLKATEQEFPADFQRAKALAAAK